MNCRMSFTGLAVIGWCLVASANGSKKQPVDRVNTGIGSVSHMLVPTFRTVQRPHGMYRFNGPAGQFTEDRIPDIWLQNPGHRDSPVFSVRPFAGGRDAAFGPWTATWDQEHATPYSYDVFLDLQGVKLSVAPGEKTAIFTFDFERDGAHGLSFGTKDGSGSYALDGRLLTGTDVFHGLRDCAAKVHLAAEFDTKPAGCETAEGRTAVFFGSKRGTVRMRLGVSYLSIEQAKRNLRGEIAGWDSDALAAGARKRWNDVLSQIEVEGGTDDEKSVFYTALWRCHERMVNITEEGRYLGFDGKAHETDGTDQYTDDWIWDTFRAAHPLMTILNPKGENDKLVSYVRMAEQDPDRWMPVFPGVAGDRHSMVNRHYVIMFLDAWRKGIRGFDAQKAFELMDRTEETESLIPWHRGPLTELDRFYKEHGYYPGIRPDEKEWVKEVQTDWERRQCVSVTQGASYDAWALAEFGREIGIAADRLAKYDERAKGYAKLWNAKTQFFHPKDRDGKFIEPFDYLICGGYGARNYFTENNAWTYIWDVQHDLEGLKGLFGGASAMEAKLDAMLNASVGAKWRFTGEMPDGCTGLMGVFTMANEPAFHIPYLYTVCGRPDKTQKFVRKTLESWFRNDRMGMCGDEDGGGMSAYAVFSMMGFYPLTPGKPEYVWGSPVFRKVTIHLQNDRDFVLEAPNASVDAKYVNGIVLDGQPKPRNGVLHHVDILHGSRVTIDMGERYE